MSRSLISVVGLILASAAPAASRPPPGAASAPDSLESSPVALAQEKANLEQENRALRLELDLAEGDSAYGIIDLRTRLLRIRLRGIELGTYDLGDLTIDGDLSVWAETSPAVAGPFTVTRKEVLGYPRPSDGSKGGSPSDTLLFHPVEPSNPIPTDYNLCLSNDLILHIMPNVPSKLTVRVIWERASERAVAAFKALRNRFARALAWEVKDEPIRISFRLPEKQAQTLFLTVHNGARAMLLM